MSYHLKLNESVPDAIRRITVEQAGLAAEALSHCRASNRDKAIHDARKSVKKIRCILRLVRNDLGKTYKKDRRKLRIVAHNLARFRDRGALIMAFDKLRDIYPDDFRRPGLDSLRDHLVAHKQEAEKTADVGKAVRKMAARLRAVAGDAKTWRLETDGFAAIGPGLEHTFRRGRKTMTRAEIEERPEVYHEWRKYLKEQWYHIRLVKDFGAGVAPEYEKRLKQIDAWLDEEHNLSLLREKIVARPCCHPNEHDMAMILSRIELRQAELRANSLSLAREVYERNAGAFTRKMNQLWSRWQDGRLRNDRSARRRSGPKHAPKTSPRHPLARAA